MKNFPLDSTKCILQLTYNTTDCIKPKKKNMTEFQKPVTCIENYKQSSSFKKNVYHLNSLKPMK